MVLVLLSNFDESEELVRMLALEKNFIIQQLFPTAVLHYCLLLFVKYLVRFYGLVYSLAVPTQVKQ